MIKTEKLKVKLRVTHVKGNLVNLESGEVIISNEIMDSFLTKVLEQREPYWHTKHTKLINTLYAIRDRLVSLQPGEDLNTVKDKIIGVLEETIGLQK